MKEVLLTRQSSFSAVHYHGGTLNEPEHEHNFKYRVTLKGKPNSEGFFIDFRELEKVLQNKINNALHGKKLNEIMQNPTTENLAVWIYDKLKPVYGKLLYSVRVYETEDAFVTYYG